MEETQNLNLMNFGSWIIEKLEFNEMTKRHHEGKDNFFDCALVGNANRTIQDLKLVLKILGCYILGEDYQNLGGTHATVTLLNSLMKAKKQPLTSP